MAVDWSSLPPDLLRRLGDHHLAAGDIDNYMDMRSVCHSWRSAIPKPRPLGVDADPRFRPRHWVMLDEKESKDAADGLRCLFVNVSTGRFLRRCVPMLHDHDLLAASDGLLVLRKESFPDVTGCVLDPFTGSLLPAPDVHKDYRMATVYIVAEPAGELRVVRFPSYIPGRCGVSVLCMVAHAGHVYVVDSEGCMFRILDKGERPSFGYGELITRINSREGLYLMESAGELLLIRLPSFWNAGEVYRVDVEHKAVECLNSIGGRALFLGPRGCLSVDADKFPSIHPNCVHYYRYGLRPGDNQFVCRITYRFDLSNDRLEEDISDDWNVKEGACLIGPVSLAKVLLDYCTS